MTRNPSRVGQVHLSDLRCSFGSRIVVSIPELRIEAGEHVAIVGANGSGKSTLLRTVCGLHRDFTGSIVFDGHVMSPHMVHRHCAWVPQRQNPGRFPLRVSELLASSGAADNSAEMSRLLGMDTLVDRPLTTLSGGQLQRTLLARGFASLQAGATILIADEPTAALDFDGQSETARLLAALPQTVIVATHDRAVATQCDRVLEMAAGRIRELT